MKKIILAVLAASLIIGSCTGCLKRKNDSTSSEAINTINNVNTVATETTDSPDLISPNSNIQADSENPLEIYAYDFFMKDYLVQGNLCMIRTQKLSTYDLLTITSLRICPKTAITAVISTVKLLK